MTDPAACLNEHKLSIVQKFIRSIDTVTKKAQKAEIVYLSNNNIKCLNGIQQFRKLRSLSVANNEVWPLF
jgi:hypothetical protein